MQRKSRAQQQQQTKAMLFTSAIEQILKINMIYYYNLLKN